MVGSFGGTIEMAYALEYESMDHHNHIFMLAEPDVKCLVHTDVRLNLELKPECSFRVALCKSYPLNSGSEWTDNCVVYVYRNMHTMKYL